MGTATDAGRSVFAARSGTVAPRGVNPVPEVAAGGLIFSG
jgi:hypothetical protein